MKKLLIGALLIASPMAVNAKDYGAAGCGVGSIIFEGQSGLGPHVLAATTNGFYGTQTFAMSSGTLGCSVDDPIQSHASLYIDSNLNNVAADIARGDGEALMALAELFDVKAADRATFAAVLKDNFSVIFTSESVTSTDVMSSLKMVMKDDLVLAKYVS